MAVDQSDSRAYATGKKTSRKGRAPQKVRLETIVQLGAIAAFLLGWELLVRFMEVPHYIMPVPTGVFEALVSGLMSGVLISNAMVTATEVLLGLLFGSLFGFALGIILAEFPLADAGARPFLVASQVTPKVALAPLFIIWFGFGISSKVFIAALLVFFPVLVGTTAGIAAADADRLSLMKIYKISRWRTLFFVKLPGALPQILAGLEVATVLSVMGALIGEFVGATEGLGRLILYAGEQLDLNLVFATIIILIFMGAMLQFAVGVVRRRTLFWLGR